MSVLGQAFEQHSMVPLLGADAPCVAIDYPSRIPASVTDEAISITGGFLTVL